MRALKAITMALAIAGATTTAALAGGGYGSVKDGYGGIPVPAPIPVPETFNWYVRMDIGVGQTHGGGARESGFQYGLPSGCGGCWTANAPFGMNPSWFNSDFDTFFQGGIGFGKYLTPQFRMDVTLDSKTKDRAHAYGTYSYEQFDAPGGAGTVLWVNGTTRERIDVLDTVLLANAYYDLTSRGRFTPYIGFGLGVAARTIERRHDTREQLVTPCCGSVLAERSWSGDSRDIMLAPAAMATLGIAWAITARTVLDVNYRYTYLGEVSSTTRINEYDQNGTHISTQSSKMTIDAAHQHAIRAGIRVNVW